MMLSTRIKAEITCLKPLDYVILLLVAIITAFLISTVGWIYDFYIGQPEETPEFISATESQEELLTAEAWRKFNDEHMNGPTILYPDHPKHVEQQIVLGDILADSE